MELALCVPDRDSFPACPKCRGQYRRDATVCHCYQCCFEWDLRDPVEGILARARHRHLGERPASAFWDDLLQAWGE